jgi:Ca2+-binding RTX toxin-like protein
MNSDQYHGGPDADRIEYLAGPRQYTSLAVSLDSARNDGQRCPDVCVLDNVARSIEYLSVEAGVPSTIVGSGRPNGIRVFGRGSDHDSTVSGMRGDDELSTGGGDDSVAGGRGNDEIDTNGGDDALDGGRGNDRCRAGPGTDSAFECEDVQGVP